MNRRLPKIPAVLRRHLALTVTAVVALVVAAATGAAELTARHMIRARVAAAAPALGEEVAVSTAGDWALWDLAGRTIPRLEVRSDDARLGPLPGARVRAQLDDVRLGAPATVGSTRVQVTASPRSLAAAIRAAVPSVTVGSVTPDPAEGTVLAAVGPGGAGRLTLRPVLADGKVTFTVDGFTLFGRSVPTGALGTGSGVLGPEAGAGQDYPLGLRATSVQVRPDGLHIALEGGRSTVRAT
ncbi:hypothetical protein KPP03845_100774 [Streptomyces xanthophaeus]|uniref:LmeA family phospholipid-binding protein n=1 Tax=Streptomyces xanthophaeus TaxID=67385 RepID=UPI00233EF27D|nr:LmeA family phospholipid-binding protein [Streptomyces xanthophaeus]WCD84451.1 hypothetical protein KPP03845_100774 [Streptomyces xanthophaeus]